MTLVYYLRVCEGKKARLKAHCRNSQDPSKSLIPTLRAESQEARVPLTNYSHHQEQVFRSEILMIELYICYGEL